jgi:hypothetical protein
MLAVDEVVVIKNTFGGSQYNKMFHNPRPLKLCNLDIIEISQSQEILGMSTGHMEILKIVKRLRVKLKCRVVQDPLIFSN